VTGRPDEPPDITFRTASAPGLEEDDLFAALHGLPGHGGLWGEGLPAAASPPVDEPWDEERERRRRHREVLRRWGPRDEPERPAATG
jgi:hypothetical protein